jgi:hypothetical protein
MSRINGKLGGVYTTPVIINTGEAAWSELVDGDVTASADTDFQVGTKSAKFACGAGLAAGDIIATESLASANLSTYKKVYLWIKSSVELNSGDLQLLLDDTAQCASPIKSLDIPALEAGTWTRVLLDLGTATGLTAVISVGLKQVVDKGAFNLWVDDIKALKAVAGIKEWSLSWNSSLLNATAFDSVGVAQYIVGPSDWSGSFSGYKDGAPLSFSTEITIALAESLTSAWMGQALINGVSPAAVFDGLVTASYTFQGIGELEFAKV